MAWEIAMDIGGETVRTATKERGVIFSESAFVATRGDKVIPFAWGNRALALYGRAPEEVRFAKPIRNGMLTDDALLEKWITRQIDSAQTSFLSRPTLLMSVSPACHEVHRREMQKSAIDAGATSVGLVRADVLAAIGAGRDVMGAEACCVVDVGAEQMTASLISGGRVIKWESLPYGMSRADEMILATLREKRGWVVGPRTARELKHAMAAATPLSGGISQDTPVFDLAKSLPRLRSVPAEDIAPCVEPIVTELLSMCARLISYIPVELAADLTRTGMTITGGGARLFGLDKRVSEVTGLTAQSISDPEDAVINGLSEILKNPKKYDPLITQVMEAVRRP